MSSATLIYLYVLYAANHASKMHVCCTTAPVPKDIPTLEQNNGTHSNIINYHNGCCWPPMLRCYETWLFYRTGYDCNCANAYTRAVWSRRRQWPDCFLAAFSRPTSPTVVVPQIQMNRSCGGLFPARSARARSVYVIIANKPSPRMRFLIPYRA